LDRKIRVAAVNYLNTKPLIYGFENGMMKDEVELITDFPASIADMLIYNKVDIALVPVATIPLLKEHYIITDYCIGTEGEVASVCLFSDVPLEEIETILLDYQSRSSVGLLKILLKEYWKITPKLIYAAAGYEKNIVGKTAGLVIGDRAFAQRKKSKFIYDLGTAWLAMTGLPFVFAAWVSNKKMSIDFIQAFNKATKQGVQKLVVIANLNKADNFDMVDYYTKCISYTLDKNKRLALKKFLQLLSIMPPET
jgi:chorismate dehydratase